MNKSILRKELEKINKKNNRRFHMPGHKGQGQYFDFYAYDITEIPGSDNLHDAKGVIEEAQKKLAKIYNSEEAAILINGSTTGIHSAILGACSPGEQLLVPVNCHRAVFGALALGRIEGVFIKPKIQKDMGFAQTIAVERVEKALAENPEIKGMILTNPTYYGTTSDIQTIAEILHKKGKFLIIDEAHGAHLHFNDKLPMDGIAAGADVVIQSTHKIVGSFTQSSLLHFQGDRMNRQRIKSFLALLQSSSPSYPLMISVEEAVDRAYEKGVYIFESIIQAHLDFCRTQELNAPITLYDGEKSDTGYDRSKWLFYTPDISGGQIEALLSEHYGIQCEMSSQHYVLAMTGMGTTREDLETLIEAVNDVNNRIKAGELNQKGVYTKFDQSEELNSIEAIKTEMPLWEALYSEYRKKIVLKESVGCLVGDFIIPYPPGIPVLLPGSRMTAELMAYLSHLLDHGVAVVGIDENQELLVIQNKRSN